MKLFRVLRIFKLSYTSGAIKTKLTPLLIFLLQFLDVFLYLLLFLLAFGVIEVTQFQGSYYYRCRVTAAPVGAVWEIDRSVSRFCSAYGYGSYTCPFNRHCGHPSMHNLDFSDDSLSNMPETYYGVTNFDLMPKALLANLQIMTHDGWSGMMYKTGDTTNAVFARIYFPLLVYLSCFYFVRLVTAVLVDSFLKAQQPEEGEAQVVPAIELPSEQKPSGGAQGEGQGFGISVMKYAPKELPENSAEKKAEGNKEANKYDKMPLAVVGVLTIRDKIVKVMNVIVIIMVVANIVAMCFDRLDIPESELEFLDILNSAFLVFFVLEMLARIWVEGPVRYFCSDPFNVLDLVINLFGIAETILTQSGTELSYGVRGVVSVLRSLRAFKLIGKWKTLREAVVLLCTALSNIVSFLILMALFVFIYTVIGMELFAGKVKFNNDNEIDLTNGKSLKYNFDSLTQALIAAYTLIIGDNWSDFMYSYSRINYAIGVIYYYTGIFVLNVFFVSAFMAIFLQHTYTDKERKQWEKEERNEIEPLSTKKTANRERTLLTALKVFKFTAILSAAQKKEDEKPQPALAGKALFLLSETNKFRKAVHSVATSSIFKWSSYVLTVATTVLLTLQTPLHDPDGNKVRAIKIAYIVFVSLFFIEVALKSIAHGFLLNGDNSFLRSPLNIIDGVSAIALTVHIALGSPSHKIAGKVLMGLVSLRAIRLATAHSRFAPLTLTKRYADIVKALGVCALFLFAPAIISITFFKGRLYYCDMSNLPSLNVQGEPNACYCMDLGGEWRNSDIGFDNIFKACLTLFELITGNSWWTLVTRLAEGYGSDKGDVRKANYATCFFAVACSVIGFLYIRALFSCSVCQAFDKEKKEIEGVSSLNYPQRRFVQLSKTIFKTSPLIKVTAPANGCSTDRIIDAT